MILLIWGLALLNCLVFYATCEKISLKPTKQKLIATPIYSVLMVGLALYFLNT